MKKLVLIFSLFVLSLSLIYSQSITIISPNGGENWVLGSTHTITWTSSGISGTIDIKLYKDGKPLGYIAKGISNSGSYSWTINKLKGGVSITAGTDYKVYIRKVGVTNDFSDYNFSISSSNFINSDIINGIIDKGIGINKFKFTNLIDIIKPKRDLVRWKEGEMHDIRWDIKTIKGKRVNIYLVDSDKKIVKTLKTNWYSNHGGNYGMYMWKIPFYLFKNELDYLKKYKIKIETTDKKNVGFSGNIRINISIVQKEYKVKPSRFITTWHKRYSGHIEIPIHLAHFGEVLFGYDSLYVHHTFGKDDFVGYVYRTKVVFNVDRFRFLNVVKAYLHFSHLKGDKCQVRIYKITDQDDYKELFKNIKFEPIKLGNPVDVTVVVKDWAKGTNFGFLFTGSDESYSHKTAKCIEYLGNVYLTVKTIERESQ